MLCCKLDFEEDAAAHGITLDSASLSRTPPVPLQQFFDLRHSHVLSLVRVLGFPAANDSKSNVNVACMRVPNALKNQADAAMHFGILAWSACFCLSII